MLGEAYSKLNMLNDAEIWYREALRAKADHIPAHLTMARLQQKKVCKRLQKIFIRLILGTVIYVIFLWLLHREILKKLNFGF